MQNDYLKDLLKVNAVAKTVEKPVEKPIENALDAVTTVVDAAEKFITQSIESQAVYAVNEWSKTTTEDLGEGEGFGDRLMSMVAGIADEDMDGEVSEEESEIMNSAINAMGDYLSALGVPDEDIEALFDDFDNDVALNVHAQLATLIPEGNDADLMASDFVFGDGSDESAMDNVVYDAVYKKVIKFIKGKKQWAKKRISGVVKRTAKQKLGMKKALRKAWTGMAKISRAKSMKRRKAAGL